jgi:hypothetical protein
MKRRDFFKGLGVFCGGSLAGGGVTYLSEKMSDQSNHTSLITGSIQGAPSSIGHKLRVATSGPIQSTRHINTVIVGGGISGLSAGWWLNKEGFSDFLLLELDKTMGGNSVGSENETSRYPWGAHYLPIPTEQSSYVRTLLEETGSIQGYDAATKEPIYNELHLCSDPHERLFMEGKWHEGLIPQKGLSHSDREQFARFFAKIETLKTAYGSDKKKAFALPLAFSSEDTKWTKLDQISFADYLDQKGYTSRPLRWYLNYCCRDDYGTTTKNVSAWAGLHFFASRTGTGSNCESQAVLTWPEGNYFLAKALAKNLNQNIRTNALVTAIDRLSQNSYQLTFQDTTNESFHQIHCENIIYAAPRFTALRTIKIPEFFKDQSYSADLTYNPWLVANVTVSKAPAGLGAPLSWDNVSYYSPSIGYIVANHQSTNLHNDHHVLTYYFPLSDWRPDVARTIAGQRSWHDWSRFIAADLETMNPDLRGHIQNIDVWLWGHAMISPKPGYIWGASREKMQKSLQNLHFAHSDMSGISIFEEAQYHGVEAAKKVLLTNKRILKLSKKT